MTAPDAGRVQDAYSEGAAEFKKGNHAEAVKRFRVAVGLDPGFYRGWAYLAMAHAAAGEIDPAIEAYRKCIEVEPGYHKAFNNVGELYRRKGQLHHAVMVFKMATEIEGAQAHYFFNLGITYGDLGMLDHAEKALAQAHAMAKDDVEFALELSQVRVKRDQPAAAVEALEGFLQAAPAHERAAEIGARIKFLRRRAEPGGGTAAALDSTE